MGKFGLYGFTDRVFAAETLLYHLFHDGNIPYIPEKTIHLHDVFKCKSDKCKTLFHLVKCAVYLLFDTSADISYTVIEKTEIACFDNSAMRPFFVDIITFNHNRILRKIQKHANTLHFSLDKCKIIAYNLD